MPRLPRLRRRPPDTDPSAGAPPPPPRPALARAENAVALMLGAGLMVLVVAVFFALSAPGEGDGLRGPRDGPPEPPDSFLSRILPPTGSEPGAAVAAGLRAELGRLSPAEKAAQVMLVDFTGRDARSSEAVRRVRTDAPGGLVVAPGNYGGPRRMRALARAIERSAGRAGQVAPLLLTAQEGGPFRSIRDVGPPRAPGRTDSVAEARRETARSARALRALGIEGVLGPVIDVAPEDGGAVGRRAYSDDPALVTDFARATVEAYRRAGLLTAPAHFPGLGAGSGPTEEGPATVGLGIEEIRRRDLRPFRAALDAGASAILVGHGLYGSDDFAAPASQSPFILTELLRRELGFRGLAITDDLSEGAISRSQGVANAAVASLRAGADMVQVFASVKDQRTVRDAITHAVREDRLPAARLDEAVLRVLAAKRALERRRR